MLTPSLLLLLASTSLIEARSLHEVRHLHNLVHKRQADSTVLAPNAIQSGSFVDGSTSIGANEANQAKSLTSQNNFINNCAGKTLTNGFQNTDGSCNGITMGDIPAKTNMVSAIITNPLPGSANIESDTTFNITVQVSNLVAGFFTNADATYYAAPQFLQGGNVVGHTHVTVQDMGSSLNPTTALDATKFAFFKGINDAGNGKGLLTATVTGGLPAGNYRVCTMCSASNHQPVLMPVAQRGTPDDCTKFTVIGNGNTPNDAANDGVKGLAAAALAQSALEAGPGFVSVSSTAAAASGTGSSSVIVDDGSGAVYTTAVGGSSDTTTSALGAATSAPFSNSTETAKGGNGGKGRGRSTTKVGGGSGDKGKTTSVAEATSSAAAVETSSVESGTTTKANGGGKDVATSVQSASSGKATGKRIITIIETFFVFEQFRGGACPSVGKSGEKFNVLDELFDDLASAAAAACGQQFSACISFSGPGFSVEECGSQKDECASVASTQSATATTPATLTASVTIPVTATASVPGSVVATETIAPTSVASVTSAAGGDKAIVAASQTTAASAGGDAAASSACSIVTGTVTVDAVSSSLPTLVSSVAPFSNSTATVSSAAASSSVASSSAAIGGIEAPAIVSTGDATRPFSVNGNTFVNKSAAIQRSCDVQFNACANAVNGGKLTGVTLADCSAQETTCEDQQ